MRNLGPTLFAVAMIAAALPEGAHAQGIQITPAIGAYIPASGVYELRDAANDARLEKEAALGLGLNVEIGWLRGSLAYASGATLSEEGTSGDIGDGSLLAVAADAVFRPIPRLIVLQPYLLGGVGLVRQDYSYDDDGTSNPFPDEDSEFALHAGVGADISLGALGIVVEVTDFITRDAADDWSNHDAFALLGLKLRLF